jgi:pimeloyl-ACP methyl ester carboxylesterase
VVAYVLRPIEFTIDGLTLRGTAHVPRIPEPTATAVLHHGFGGQRTEAYRPFVSLARELAERGIAVVTFDRAGHGESDGDFYDTTVSGDIVHALELLRRMVDLDFVDADNVHLLGTSMGAVVAGVVAAKTEVAVRSLTYWSPAAVFVDEIRSGYLQGRTIDSVETEGYFDFNGLRLGPTFFDDARDFDVYGSARGYTGPVLVLHGTEDFIPASYARAYADVYNDAMDFELVTGADHLWSNVPCREHLLRRTVDFITSHTMAGVTGNARSGPPRASDELGPKE